jgi:hypothetical protein
MICQKLNNYLMLEYEILEIKNGLYGAEDVS